ncbi:ABC transporter ATP-binding protein [Fulvivirga lutea]|uniref:ABC transporter ATP-binding protein n=1 Tax=Fulvivirga lutea TaxID=2810512 RepID=A0A974WEC6_9BACT|nr:ABC transporter ATP-binding protein [Fulvivirga lutea]QSE96496.1 ABC transporter ATP-binding protein [Fulvivirga lutea]
MSTAKPDSILRADHINKYFHDPVEFHVLKDISLEIKKGEFVSIMGKSGCGKSTLLYILSTMDTDYTGNLYLKDKLLNGETGDELARVRNEHIGFIFQFHYLLPEFTILQNVMLPALKLGKKTREEIERDAMDKLNLLDIGEQAHKLASKVSGGQKQRVAIARALINSPSIIMADEPTGNLDSKNSDNVFNILKDLSHSENLSLLVVTHDDDFAKRTDRVITMEDGKILSHY